jgi:rhodanese-related sulfurtransferase
MNIPPNLEIAADKVKQITSAGGTEANTAILIDCRTADEHAIARIDGSILIPMQEIAERLSELEPWREKPIVVHCHHGVRSLRVTHFLREKGFSQAQSMRGGIDAWSVEVDPSVPRY